MLGDANHISNSSLEIEARNVIVNVLKLDVISVVLCNFTYYIVNGANQHMEHSERIWTSFAALRTLCLSNGLLANPNCWR